MQPFVFEHGQLRCGTVLVNDIDQTLTLYTELLSQCVVEETYITASLADSWGAPKLSGARCYLLQPEGANKATYVGSYIRLVQSPVNVEPVPHATTYGWCAFEINVLDVFKLADKIDGSKFDVVGIPKKMDGISSVIPMQVVGPDQEVFYLNQVLSSTPETELPMANHTVDQFFIAILASADIDAVVSEYTDRLALDSVDSHEIRYSLINRAFDLDPSTTHRLSVLHKGRLPSIEVDQYPEKASARRIVEGSLPLGNAMVSIAVESLDDLPIGDDCIAKATLHDSKLYGGYRSVVVRGSSNELIELIECQ